MLTPNQLDSIPDAMVELYAQVEIDIIKDMARRLSKVDFIPSVAWQYQKMIAMGNFNGYILNALSAYTGKTREELRHIMEYAGEKSLSYDIGIYKRAGLDPRPISASTTLQAVLQSGLENTNGLFVNLTRTTANTATKQFENLLDRAWMRITTGAFDHNSAIKMAIKELADKGVASIAYPSGHTDYMDVAVRRATLTGINQTALKLQDTLADEMGSDLVETTAHAGARPSHALWQGKVFSRSGKHPKYPSFVEGTGYGTGAGLGGWNCRHSYFPFFEGASEPTYTKAELADMNEKKYKYNGQKLTEYEATQKQRTIERNIRKWKREYVGMDAAGQPTSDSSAKLANWQQIQKEFLKQTGLKRQSDRELVSGFGRSQAVKSTWNVRRSKTVEAESEIMYNKKRKEILDLIRSDNTPKSLNIGNQNKHIRDSKGYISGRSYIHGDLKTAQELVNQYHGTGEIRFADNGEWIKKEFISLDHDIGVRINQKTGEETLTNAFAIHYGNKGTHIIPSKRRD